MIASSIFLAPGPWQIVLIVVVVLLLFGGKKIPELMRGLGSGIKEFKDADITDSSKKKKKLASNEEILKPAIREFWKSFFNQIGVSQISYGLTSEFISYG